MKSFEVIKSDQLEFIEDLLTQQDDVLVELKSLNDRIESLIDELAESRKQEEDEVENQVSEESETEVAKAA